MENEVPMAILSNYQYIILFTMTFIGIIETWYLILKRKRRERPVCIIGDKCTAVLESKYNRIFFVHNDIAGLFFYVAMVIFVILLAMQIEPMQLWDDMAETMMAVATVLSIIFVYLQWRVLKAWCTMCIVSAVTIFIMAWLVFIGDLI